MGKGIPRVFLAAGLALLVGNATAAPYSFTNIADTSGPFDFFLDLSLNNSGTVAFSADLDTGEQGIFTGSGGPTNTIATTSGPFSFLSGLGLSLNNSGTVAFRGFLDAGGQGIFTGGGGPTRTIVDTTRGPFNEVGIRLSLNNSGMVAFSAFLDTGEEGIFIGSGGPTATIADNRGQFDFFVFGSPSVNDTGTVAFGANLDTGEQGIFIGSGGPTTPIADNRGQFDGVFTPSLNDLGTLAFFANLDNGGQGIFTSSGGPTTTIVDTNDGPITQLAGVPSLNNNGIVAFVGLLPGEMGIFTGPDPLADEVIGTGDTLFGSTVTTVRTDSESLNDAGQIAFGYLLADGRQGIARADPLAIPEPGTLPLLLAGLLGAMLWRKANQRHAPLPGGNKTRLIEFGRYAMPCPPTFAA